MIEIHKLHFSTSKINTKINPKAQKPPKKDIPQETDSTKPTNNKFDQGPKTSNSNSKIHNSLQGRILAAKKVRVVKFSGDLSDDLSL
jgi:hypothetical protein